MEDDGGIRAGLLVVRVEDRRKGLAYLVDSHQEGMYPIRTISHVAAEGTPKALTMHRSWWDKAAFTNGIEGLKQLGMDTGGESVWRLQPRTSRMEAARRRMRSVLRRRRAAESCEWLLRGDRRDMS